MMSFTELNKEANYYAQIGKKTGENYWNQDEFQSSFIKLIESCDLSKEQLGKLEGIMIGNNAELDMKPSNNKSVVEFEIFSKNKKEIMEQSKGINLAA